MIEAILLALWVGTSLFFICREIKAKSDRDSHEYWLSELRECLHSIENEFSRRCLEIAEKALSQNCSISSSLSQARDLKEEYITDVNSKIIKRKGEHFFTSLPTHIEKEYKRNINEIAEVYRNIFNIINPSE